MSRIPSKRRYSIGELVTAAYKAAGRVTRDPRIAAVVASRTLETWLAHSTRPDMVEKLRSIQTIVV
jgi:hypothetical protein